MAFLQAAVLPILLAAAALVDGGFLGVYVTDSDAGPVVAGVIPDTPAAKAGFVEGDRFVSINGKATPNQEAFLRIIGSYDVGDRVRIKYVRGEEERTTRVRLGERPANIEGRPRGEEEVEEVEAEEAEEAVEAESRLRPRGHGRPFLGVQIEDSSEGLRVVDVVEGSSAEKAGVKSGDLIVRLGRSDIENSEDLSEVLGKAKVGQAIGMRVLRKGGQKNLEVKLGARDTVVELEDVTNEAAERAAVRARGKQAAERAQADAKKARAAAEKAAVRARADAKKARESAEKAAQRARADARKARGDAAEVRADTAPRAGGARVRTRESAGSAGSDASVRELRGEIRDLRREIAELRKLIERLDRDK